MRLFFDSGYEASRLEISIEKRAKKKTTTSKPPEEEEKDEGEETATCHPSRFSEYTAVVTGDKPTDMASSREGGVVSSPDSAPSVSGPVTNEDIMKKLCANGEAISSLATVVSEMRATILTLQNDNDSLRKEVDAAKKREQELKEQITEVRYVANLAERRTNDLDQYIRRNNIRIFGVPEGGELQGLRAESAQAVSQQAGLADI